MPKIWEDKEINYLKDNYIKMTDAEIAIILCRSASSIKSKRQDLGFEKDKAHRKYNFNDVINEFEKTDYILISNKDDYIDSATNSLKYICPHHVEKGIMTISLGHLQSGRGCYFCGRERTENAHKIDCDENIKQCQNICNNKGFKYIETYKSDGRIYIKYICPKHKEIGVQYMRKGNMNRSNIVGCPYCLDTKKYKFSKGEKKIKEVLDNMGIVNVGQYTFNDCRDINMLPFDFYLPINNKIIEFDGQHHFKPVTFNGITEEQAIINYHNTIRHDKIKNQYCLNNHIDLLRIPYYEYDKIETKIQSFLERKII